jgi:putative GTP pyrophosphokinase
MNYIEDYKKIKPIYEGFSQNLIALFRAILDANNIRFHLIEGRAKDIDSFKNKIELKKGKYSNPLDEIMDLCGVRIIVYYQTDIDKIDSLIRDNFEVNLEHSVDKSTILKSNEFGYLSNHYIIRINSIRSNLPEWNKFKDLNAEIQLRTVLQHSWAAISHELEYKSKFDIPDLLKRKLFRLAGLFELADEQFVQVKQKQFDLAKAIESKEDYENVSVYNEINLDTIRNYFEENQSLISDYAKIGKNAGFEILNYREESEKLDQSFSSIVTLSKLIELNSVEELDLLLEKAKSYANEYIKSQFLSQETDESEERHWIADGIFMIHLILMNELKKDKLKNYNPKNWSSSILEQVKGTINEWKKTK